MFFFIKCNQTGLVWLFNCPEGCQNILTHKKVKLNQITGIIITHLSIHYISGIIGLLSSFSLNNRQNKLKLYGPAGLQYYLQFLRKYSHTTFQYYLDVYIASQRYIDITKQYTLFIQPITKDYSDRLCCFIEQERKGKFKFKKAQIFQLPQGSLYGNLKRSKKFLLPDGQQICGKYFTNNSHLGLKISHSKNVYCKRNQIEIIHNTDILIINYEKNFYISY